MTNYEITFWEVGGNREMNEEKQAPSMRAALEWANDEAEAAAIAHGTRWVVVSVCAEQFNSEESLRRITWDGALPEPVEAA